MFKNDQKNADELETLKFAQGAEKYDCVYLKYLVIILYIA
jgi:hypothetical protein